MIHNPCYRGQDRGRLYGKPVKCRFLPDEQDGAAGETESPGRGMAHAINTCNVSHTEGKKPERAMELERNRYDDSRGWVQTVLPVYHSI